MEVKVTKEIKVSIDELHELIRERLRLSRDAKITFNTIEQMTDNYRDDYYRTVFDSVTITEEVKETL